MDDQGRLTAALADSYAIEREVGRGGMATVYLAQDLKHDRPVAVKVLHPELAAGLGAERFVREIEISANLSHPHILPLFDSGEAAGFLYYVMPYVEGESLKDRLDRDGKLSVDEAIRLTDQVSSALAYAHDQGVVHRDIKPANILLTGDQAVVADFGIARALEAAGAEGLTGTGMAVGTPAYMSPEQAMGGADIDARADVYALGCVLFEMVSGGLPFEGTGPQAMAAKQVAQTAPSLRKTDSEIPVYLDRAVARAMATDPGQRFTTASALNDALTTGTIVPRVRPPGSRRRGLLAGAVAAVLLLVALGVTAMMGGQRMESLAVLPLTDLTGDPEQEFLAAGIHEALISELGQLGLSVTARATMARYRDTEKGIAEIAEELGVDGVIEGSVFRGGDSLEIATRLYDRNEQEVWTGSFDGVLEDVVAMYRGFARAIADEIRLRLDSETEAVLDEESPVNPDIYEAYLRGMHLLNNPRSPQDYLRAIEHFEAAVEQNPTDARAYAGMAFGYTTIGHSPAPPPDALTKARAAAERVIRLDSTLADGWVAVGEVYAYSERTWEAARQAFVRANELNPSLSMNHYHYAWYLGMFGTVEQAVAEHERAKELDPLTPMHTTWLPALYWFSRDYETALSEARAAVDRFPEAGIGQYVLGESAAKLGLWDEAIAAHEKMITIFPPFVAFLGHTYIRAGRMEEGLAILEQLEAQPPSSMTAVGLALMHAALGNRDAALNHLAFEPEHAWTPAFATAMYSDFDEYRDDPRYRALLRSWNLRYEPGDLVLTSLPPLAADSAGVSEGAAGAEQAGMDEEAAGDEEARVNEQAGAEGDSDG